jgi:hypothetical protein
MSTPPQLSTPISPTPTSTPRAAGRGCAEPPTAARSRRCGSSIWAWATSSAPTSAGSPRHAPDAADWGIAAFTGMGLARPTCHGRSRTTSTPWSSTSPSRPRPEVISSIVAVHGSDDHDRVAGLLRLTRRSSIVTSTVTEAGYRRNESGGLDLTDPAVAADIAACCGSDPPVPRDDRAGSSFVAGLLARRAADAGPLTFVPCDNVPDNGEMAQHGSSPTAPAPSTRRCSRGWTSTRRFRHDNGRPDHTRARPTPTTMTLLAQTGVDDPSLVVTEPYHRVGARRSNSSRRSTGVGCRPAPPSSRTSTPFENAQAAACSTARTR